jgi:hypothetical protein
MTGTYEPSPVEISRFVHWTVHLMARKGVLAYDEAMMLSDCWEGWTPSWAEALADQEADPRQWCPALDPSLREVPDEPEGALDDLEARSACDPGARP